MTSVYVSTFFMMTIAIDRYQTITNPLKNRINSSQGWKIVIPSIWLISFLLSLPHAAYNQVVQVTTVFRTVFRCRVVYPDDQLHLKQWIMIITFLTQYIIPLSITAIIYLLIGIQIWKRVQIGHMTEEQANLRVRFFHFSISQLINS